MSWSTCLPCLYHTSSNDSLTNHQPQQRNRITPLINSNPNPNTSSDDLRRLLTDPISDSEQGIDAELLSLHSNPGRTRRVNRKKIKQHQQQQQQQDAKKITFFGFDLFGRSKAAPIQLPDDDDVLYRNNNGGRREEEEEESIGPITRTTTTATFDSDAAPLDAATIDNLSGSGSAAVVAQRAQAEEEERRRNEEKEERRRKRKERKEMKRIAQVLSAGDNGGEFEGFQGSGDGYPAIPSPYRAGSDATTYQEPHVIDGSQPQPQAPPSPTALLPHLAMKEDEDDEGADLDGVVYTQRRRPPPNHSNGGSDSRSRTSNSISDRYSVAGYQQPPTQTRSSKHKSSSSISDTPKKRKSKSKSSKSTSSHTSSLIYNNGRSSASNSNSGYTNTDSTSLASPTSPSFFDESNTSIATVISPSTIEQGQGFFDLEDDVMPQVGLPPVVPEQKPNEITARLGGGFPSTGFGGGFGRSRGGAFLANTVDGFF